MSDDENAKIGCLCHFGAAFEVHIQRQLSSIQLSVHPRYEVYIQRHCGGLSNKDESRNPTERIAPGSVGLLLKLFGVCWLELNALSEQ